MVGVIDAHLKETGTGWLVGDKCTYADLSFIPWDMMLGFLMGDEAPAILEAHPHFKKWHGKRDQQSCVARVSPCLLSRKMSYCGFLTCFTDTMMARPAVAKVVHDKHKATSNK